jgi:hypothetical protein
MTDQILTLVSTPDLILKQAVKTISDAFGGNVHIESAEANEYERKAMFTSDPGLRAGYLTKAAILRGEDDEDDWNADDDGL